MRTPLKSFKIIKKMYALFVKAYRELEPNLMICEKEDFDNIENALKDYEMEHALRIRLENANYELVRKNQENEKKLEAIKDLESKLGIDLITLFKALKNGFYTKSNNGIKFWKEDDKHFVYVRDLKYDIEICCEECENAIGAVPTMFLERSTKDYGKTWALTKEELENE